MRLRILLIAIIPVFNASAQAQICAFTFPNLSACSGSDCRIVFDVRPRGVARVLPGGQYGDQLGINFGERSIFQLGDNGRMSFGHSGGVQALRIGQTSLMACQFYSSGLRAYTVDMTNSGWLDFSGNNRIELNPNNVFVLGTGSKIDGRLDLQSEGTVSIGVTPGSMTMPNLDIDAANGIMLSGQGDIQTGNLRNQGTSSANQGINISAEGKVVVGAVATADDFTVTAGGDITVGDIDAAEGIELRGKGDIRVGNLRNQAPSSSADNRGVNMLTEGAVIVGIVDVNNDFAVTAGGDITITQIKNADSISLAITPPAAGVIKIGGRRTTDNPVICAPTDNCNGFELADDGGSSGDDCNTVNSDPGAANNCGGGATGPGFCLLLSAVGLLRRLRVQPPECGRCSPPPERSV
jgi:hypothetical protein